MNLGISGFFPLYAEFNALIDGANNQMKLKWNALETGSYALRLYFYSIYIYYVIERATTKDRESSRSIRMLVQEYCHNVESYSCVSSLFRCI